jgi:4-hydroxy-tetrahydrodipicolinate synthase
MKLSASRHHDPSRSTLSKTSETLTPIWSASPTPLAADGTIDIPSIPRMVEHHLRLQIDGLMLCGSCGEGPWLPDRERETLVKETIDAAAGRIPVAVQITDNSVQRMLELAGRCADWGADMVVVAQPYHIANRSPRRIFEIIRDTVRESPLPAGFYDRGTITQNPLDAEFIPELISEPNIALVKDSSANMEKRTAYAHAASLRPGLRLLNGDEFCLPDYLSAGYHGALLGGAIFNGWIARQIVDAHSAGDASGAATLQERMNELMWVTYGGKSISCWLSGLKYLLCRMEVFSSITNLPDYKLSDECRQAIDEIFDGGDANGFLAELLPDPI